jgi:hypothetical protein
LSPKPPSLQVHVIITQFYNSCKKEKKKGTRKRGKDWDNQYPLNAARGWYARDRNGLI